MSDMDNSNLEAKVDISVDQGNFASAEVTLGRIEKVWNRLATLPPIDLNTKFKPVTTSIGSKSTTAFRALGGGGSSSQGTFSESIAQAKIEEQDIQKLSYSWDNIFRQELSLFKNKEKQESILSLLGQSVHEKMKSVAASSTGAYHPAFAHEEGGLVRHSKAVAQAAYNLAGMTGYKGDTDVLVGAALTHDMWKLGLEGEKQFTDPKHPEYARDMLKQYGLTEEGELAASHMGNMFKGAYKNAPKVGNEGQKLLHEADWYMSRKYAQDYVKWNKAGGIESMDMPGLMAEAEKRGEHPMLDAEDPIKKAADEEKKAAKEAKERENSWHSILSSAKKLVAILAGGGLIGKFITAADKGISTGASLMLGGMGAFTGLSQAQMLDNQMREAKTMMPAGTISNVLMRLQEQRGIFKTTGEGELLWKALSGNIGELMTGNKPMQEVYGEAVDRYIKLISGAKTTTEREKYQAEITKTFGPEMLGFVNFGVSQGTTWSGMGSRTSPAAGLGGWTEDVVGIQAEMAKFKLGIHDSMMSLYTDFKQVFGVPFLSWWDKTLRGLISKMTDNWDKGKREGDAIEAYTKLIQGKNISPMGDTSLAKEYDRARKAQQAGYKKSSRYSALSDVMYGTGYSTETSRKLAAERLLGRKLLPGESVSSAIQETMSQEGVGEFELGQSTFYFPSSAENTTKAVDMFRSKYKGQKAYSPIIDILSKIKDVDNPYRLPSAVDSIIPGLLQMINSDSSMIPLVSPILQQLQSPKDVSSNKGAITVQLSANFPNATNAEEIKRGINSAVNSIPTAIDNGYLSLYAAG